MLVTSNRDAKVLRVLVVLTVLVLKVLTSYGCPGQRRGDHAQNLHPQHG